MSKGKITNIHEYKKLNKIIKELPELITILNEFQQKMYPYMHYQHVGILNNNLNNIKEDLENNLSFCKKRLEREV